MLCLHKKGYATQTQKYSAWHQRDIIFNQSGTTFCMLIRRCRFRCCARVGATQTPCVTPAECAPAECAPPHSAHTALPSLFLCVQCLLDGWSSRVSRGAMLIGHKLTANILSRHHSRWHNLSGVPNFCVANIVNCGVQIIPWR